MTKQQAKNLLAQKCSQILPKNKQIPHWSVLTDMKYADTWLWNTGVRFDITKHLKLGSTLEEYQKNKFTGNFVKTSKGHLVYLGCRNSVDTVLAFDKDLLGKNKIHFNFKRYNTRVSGGGWAEKFSEMMFTEGGRPFRASIFGGDGKHSEAFARSEASNFAYWNWYDLLKQIENSTLPTDRVIAITYENDGTSIANVGRDVNKFISENQLYFTGAILLATSVFSLGLTAPQCMAMLSGIQSISSKLEKGEKITVTDISNATQPILPKSLIPYAEKGLSVAYSLEDPSPANLIKVANTLGVKDSEIQGVLSSISNPEKSAVLLKALKGAQKFDDTNLLLAVLQQQNMVDLSMTDGTNIQMAKNLLQSQGGIGGGFLSTLFGTSTSDASLTAVIPNVPNVCSALVDEYKKIMSPEEYVATVNMGTGRNDLDKKLPNLAMQSMIMQAIKSSDAGQPYILPGTIEPKYRECMALSITAETGIAVVDKSVAPPTPPKPTPPKPDDKKGGSKKKRRIAFI